MSAFLFIWRKSLWNMIRQLPKKPGKLIVILFYLALFVPSLLSTSFAPQEGNTDFLSTPYGLPVYSIIWLTLILLIGVSSLYAGTNRGSTVFTSPDVQFLFTAPLRPQTVLIYGLVGMLKSLAVLAIILPFQFPNLARLGFNSGQLIGFAILLIWSLLSFNLLAMVFYLVAQNRPRLRISLRTVTLAIPFFFLVLLIIFFFSTRDPLESVQRLTNTPAINLIPLFGWTLALARSFVLGMNSVSWFALFCLIVTPFVLIPVAYKMPADYYEDAINRVETVKKAVAKQQNRKNIEATALQKKHKGRSGINHGYGLDTLFYRHWRELRRKQPYFISVASILITGTSLVTWIPARLDAAVSNGRVYFLFIILLMQLFLRSGETVLTTELDRPLIYCLPYSPLKKMGWLTLTELVFNIPLILPSLLVFLFLLQPAWYHFMAILPILFTFPLLTIASTLIAYRVIGSVEGQISTLIQMLANMVLSAPSIAFIIMAAIRHLGDDHSPILLFLGIAVWQIIVGSILIYVMGRSTLERGLVKA